MSSEHQCAPRIQLQRCVYWQIYAFQAEEERGEGVALPLEIVNSSNITFANLFIYRVISMFQPFPYAIEIADSKNIKFENLHSYSNSKVSFDTTVHDRTYERRDRQRESRFSMFLALNRRRLNASRLLSRGPNSGLRLSALRTGFYNISGGCR